MRVLEHEDDGSVLREAVDEREEPGLHVVDEGRLVAGACAIPNSSASRSTVRSASAGSHQRSTRSRSRRRAFSGGVAVLEPASSATIAATGANVAVSVYGRAPRRARTVDRLVEAGDELVGQARLPDARLAEDA